MILNVIRRDDNISITRYFINKLKTELLHWLLKTVPIRHSDSGGTTQTVNPDHYDVQWRTSTHEPEIFIYVGVEGYGQEFKDE